jgi:hypothetical protein
VHAAQRISRLIMIKFGNRANGLPSGRRVAILTRQVQIAVWTVRTSGALHLRTSRHSGKCQDQHGYQIEPAPRP